jgi:hypothetical protein
MTRGALDPTNLSEGVLLFMTVIMPILVESEFALLVIKNFAVGLGCS